MLRTFSVFVTTAVVGVAVGYRIGSWVLGRSGGKPIVVYHGYAGPAEPV